MQHLSHYMHHTTLSMHQITDLAHMEHFSIIQALCRAAMAEPSPALRKQVERLRDALSKDGEDKQAASLGGILAAAERLKEMAPSRIERSRATLPGEVLGRNTPVPVDRETAAPLAEIIFPAEINADSPLFNPTVAQAVSTIIDEWTNFEALSAVDISPAKTCLVYGAPGTGKTRLALWIARKLDLPVILVKLDGLVSSFLGTTARNIGNLFTFANRYRCVLLLDEFDAIAKVRDDPQEVGEIKRVVNALLQNLDVRQNIGLTIGITNHPKLLDPAVWRRFEIQLEIPKPDFAVRKAIAQHFMPPVQAPDSHLRLIAWFTEGSTGAEIEALVRTYKKATTVREEDRRGLLDTLRQFATLNAARIQSERRALLFDDPANLFRAMHEDPALAFSMGDIGDIAGKDKSTISRWLGRQGGKSGDGEVTHG
ncbi:MULTISPECIES: AAA family ATPase [Pseudomonadota]|uniref:AAA family ATPase n=2 Tax=Pseudomonadota TaxID=1224 RepID=UPI001F406956|nr:MULTISPECIES: AAA family ATPase [Pseudomonadota]